MSDGLRLPTRAWLAAIGAACLVVSCGAGRVLGKGLSATDVAIGFGRVWTTNEVGVLRIDPQSGQADSPTAPQSGGPLRLATGAGAVWVIERSTFRGRGRLVAIDPHSMRPLGGPTALGRVPVALAAGSGSVWVANYLDGTLRRIDARTRRLQGPDIPVGREPQDVAAGAGAVWVSVVGRTRPGPGGTEDPIGPGRLVRVDPRTGAVLARIRVPANPGAVAADGNSVWVLAGRNPGVSVRASTLLVRVDARTDRVVATRRLPGLVLALAAARGSVWLLSPGRAVGCCGISNAGGSLERLDVKSGRVVSRWRVGAQAAALALADGAVWVASPGAAVLDRLSGGRISVFRVPFFRR
jgi:streptogramin lyase